MKTLFHYCSSSSFASIVSQKSIWLSSLSLANDTMEGRLIAQTFERLFAQSRIGAEEIEQIRNAIKSTGEICDGLGFCLSEEPGLLSQWRGYADNAQGFSIGFSEEYLRELEKIKVENESGFRLHRVLYKQDEHDKALKPTYDGIKALVDSGRLKRPRFGGLLDASTEEEKKERHDKYMAALQELWLKMFSTVSSAFLLKGAAFAEEAEWRLVSLHFKNVSDSVSYRAVENRLIPYRKISLRLMDIKSITEVYVGPKNITPINVVEEFLAQNGFADVAVRRSVATYR